MLQTEWFGVAKRYEGDDSCGSVFVHWRALVLPGVGWGFPGWSGRGWEIFPNEEWTADWPASHSLEGESKRERKWSRVRREGRDRLQKCWNRWSFKCEAMFSGRVILVPSSSPHFPSTLTIHPFTWRRQRRTGGGVRKKDKLKSTPLSPRQNTNLAAIHSHKSNSTKSSNYSMFRALSAWLGVKAQHRAVLVFNRGLSLLIQLQHGSKTQRHHLIKQEHYINQGCTPIPCEVRQELIRKEPRASLSCC